MSTKESAGIEPAFRVFAVSGADKGSDQFAHLEMKMREVFTAGGKYLAHLHFEMRELITPFVGAGYRKDTKGWLDPSAFLRAHRGAPAEDVGRKTYAR